MKVINDYVVLKKIKEDTALFIHEADKPEYYIGEVVAYDEKIDFLQIGDTVLYDSVYEGSEMKYNNMDCVVLNKKNINSRERD